MTTIDQWLERYAESHRNVVNKRLHWICVPAIMLSLFGLLWNLPVPAAFPAGPWSNWATVLVLVSLGYYCLLSVRLALGMIVISALLLAATEQLDALSAPLWLVSVAIFVLAWIGQFIGHAIEGKKPSFFQDIQFLMIGPLWLLAHLYRRIGLRY